jgi:two-component system, LytTR family, response regulator
MLRAIVIDDEQSGIDALKILISRNQEHIRLVASALLPEEGIKLIEDYLPDVVFLDISMPTMNGFELLTKLKHKNFKLIFTTAHREYAIEAIKNKASDYLLKPLDNEDFRKCISVLVNENSKKHVHSIPENYAMIDIHVKDGIIYLKQKDIIRLEASRSYTFFYLEGGVKHIASRSLNEFEEKLNPTIFYRCHKSHLINLSKVQKFVNHNGFFALMNDGSMPDISLSHKAVFLERLKVI